MREIDWRKVGGVVLVWGGVVAVAASVMVGGIIWVMGNNLPPQIPLFYSLPWGEEQLAAPGNMLWAVAAIWVVWILSWLIIRTGKERILSAFVAATGLVSEIIIILGLVRIILIIS